MNKSKVQRLWPGIQTVLFPLILFLFPLCKAGYGVDLTDTGYSLGNYRFRESIDGIWMLLTWLSNLLGSFLTKLPMGKSMLGMKIYCSLVVSLSALLGYRFFRTKMPAWVAFLGEIAAIGFCWCPTVILYNYLTYLLFLLGMLFLFRGLAGSRDHCLVMAGVLLGVNAFVRFPNNILEAGLILSLWYYGALKHRSLKKTAIQTGLCLAGYLAAFGVMVGILSLNYGSDAFGRMIGGIFGMAGSASDYTLGEMLAAILDAYGHGLYWLLYMFLCVLPGIPFLLIQKERYPKLRKVVYCLCIPILFFVLHKWGMFNFRYYQKEAALQWGVVFLLAALAITIWMLFTRMIDDEWRLIGSMALWGLLVTPLGSNNHVWPVLNNLFFIAPVVFWMIYRFVRWGRDYLDFTGKVPLFPVKAMLAGIIIAFFIQAVGIGFGYVFLDGENGEARNSVVQGNRVLHGMKTNAKTAEALQELTMLLMDKERFADKELILYGNIPGLAYYLDRKPALFSTWPDLDTNDPEQLRESLNSVNQRIHGQGDGMGSRRPLVILTPRLSAYLSGDTAVMEYWGIDKAEYDADVKLQMIRSYMEENQYQEAFANETFVVYE